MKRILGILLLTAFLGAGPGCWMQLHQLSCCAAAPAAAGPAQAFHNSTHNSSTCPVCSALHAPVTAQAIAAILNPHLPLTMVDQGPQIRITALCPIPAACRGPPADALAQNASFSI